MPETKAWMKFLWVKTPSRFRRSNRGGSAGIQTQNSFDKINSSHPRRKNEPNELTPPGPGFLYSVLRLNGVLLKEASCSGVTSLQSAELRRTERSESCWRLSTAVTHQGRCRVNISAWFFHKTSKENTITAANSNKVEQKCWFYY